MNLKIIQQTPRLTELGIGKGKTYEIDEEQPIVGNDSYKIKVPKERKGKFDFALVNEDERQNKRSFEKIKRTTIKSN